MTRNELERYLGKCVTITLLDNTVIEGTLHKTGEKAFENNPNLSIPVNFYFCTDVNNKVVKNTAFRVSHIQRISCYEKLSVSRIQYRKETMTHYCEAVGFEVMFNGYKCFAVNMGMMSSDDFVINNIDDYDMLIGFVFNGHEWRYSLRSTKVDCSKVAMLYGGGGHKGAAGFNTKECVLER